MCIRDSCKGVDQRAAGGYSSVTEYRSSQSFSYIYNSVAEGEMFSEQDILSSAKVCVIGKTIVDNLFTNGEERCV